MSNVVALNFAFDVGVKLDSMFYLMSMFFVLRTFRATRTIARPVRCPNGSGDGAPQDITDATSWSRVAIGQRCTTIRLASGELGFYVATIDTVARSIRLVSRDDPDLQWTMQHAKLDSNSLVLRGKFGDEIAELLLHRRDEREVFLTNHPFHRVKDRNDNR